MADLPILDELRRDLREAGRRERPARARRSWRPLAAVAAAGLAAMFVLVVRPDPVTHSGGPDPAPAVLNHVAWVEGHGATTTQQTEQWATPDGCHARSVGWRPVGRVRGESVQTPREARSWSSSTNTIFVSRTDTAYAVDDPLTAARRALRRQDSTIVDRITREGRAMVWREVRLAHRTRLRYLTDAKSLETFETRQLEGGREVFRVTLRTREQVPYDPRLLQMSRHAGAKTQSVKHGVARPLNGVRCG